MPIDVAQSAAQALADHLASSVVVTYNGVTGPLRVRRGWNEDTEAYSLSDGPVAAVTATGIPVASWHAPANFERAPAGGLFSWKVADLQIQIQLDVWAPHRATRDRVAFAVDQALHNDVPYRGGLYLTQPDYYGRSVHFHADPPHNHEQDSLTPSAAEWRTTWALRAECAKIIQAATPQQLNWTLRQESLDAVLIDERSIAPLA